MSGSMNFAENESGFIYLLRVELKESNLLSGVSRSSSSMCFNELEKMFLYYAYIRRPTNIDNVILMPSDQVHLNLIFQVSFILLTRDQPHFVII